MAELLPRLRPRRYQVYAPVVLSFQLSRRLTPVQQTLVATVREHDWTVPLQQVEALSRVEQVQLVQLSALHRVVGCVAASTRGLALGTEAEAELREQRFFAGTQQLKAAADLRLVAETFGEDLPWLVFKGPVLSHHYYARPDLRSSVDLDILVRGSALAEAVKRLEDVGCVLLDRNWTMLLERLSGELHLLTPQGGSIDLHWDLFNDETARESFSLDTESFFRRAQIVNLQGLAVRTLDDLDTMIHSCLHAARSGGDRLVWMKDLEQLVRHHEYDWDGLSDRAMEHRARLPVAVMLHRSSSTLGFANDVAGALRALGGQGLWRTAGTIVDRVAPVVTATASGSLTRMYARATRVDGAGAAAEFTRRAAARLQQGRGAREDNTWDPTHPESVTFPSGGETARQQFLTAIARLSSTSRSR